MSARLLLRPGARYECHGDGTCCTNIHIVGPLSRAEAQRLRQGAVKALPTYHAPVVEYHEGIKGLSICTKGTQCVFLDQKARCKLHMAVGEADKPAVCRHFPLGSTWTPQGVRVTLSHRCSCVSMIGTAPLLTEEKARSVLASPTSGRIIADHKIEKQVKWRARRAISFAEYASWEASMLSKFDGLPLEQLPPLEEVLKMPAPDALPAMNKDSWADMALRLESWAAEEGEEDGFFCTVRWAERALRAKKRRPAPLPHRPWGWTWERTAERVTSPMPERLIYGTWLADQLWTMAWTQYGSVYKALADMTGRYVLASRVAKLLQAELGLRADLAAAEGVMVADTVGASDPWDWLNKRLDEAPLGTFALEA